jgi:Flp pilus assembly protein CpaB
MPNLMVQQLSNPAAADPQKRAQRNTLSTVLLAAESSPRGARVSANFIGVSWC